LCGGVGGVGVESSRGEESREQNYGRGRAWKCWRKDSKVTKLGGVKYEETSRRIS